MTTKSPAEVLHASYFETEEITCKHLEFAPAPGEFAKQLASIKLSPVYLYLKRAFLHAPCAEDFWERKFKLAAIIYRRMRLDKTRVCTILGESGTGKELFARALGGNKPFVAINCTSLPDQLLESELFGHVRGAFTGAIDNKQGLFSTAGDGTVFLDEIGDMPANLQTKLLRALQDRVIRPVGGLVTMPINCRVICATNQDVSRIRNDLYWRLMTYVIDLPPWRHRRDEVEYVVKRYLDPTSLLSQDSLNAIKQAMNASTGNFRQLQSLVEQHKIAQWLA